MLSLRNALIMIFTLVVAAPLALFWAWPYSRVLTNEIKEVHERHLLIARNLAAALARYHAETLATFEFAASALDSGNAGLDLREMLAGLRFTEVCLADATTGRIVGRYDALAACPSALDGAALARLGAAAVEGRTVATGVYAGADGEPRMSLVRRLGNRLAVGSIDTTYFATLGRSVSFGRKGHAVVVDQNGRVLAHPLQSWEKEMRSVAAVAVVQRVLAGETGVGTFFSPALNDAMIAGFSRVPGAGWGVMVPQPISELRDAARLYQRSALGIFAMGLLVAALAACRGAITLVGPMHRLIEGATRVARGELGVQIDTRGRFVPHEMRTLMHSFNDMSKSVAEARFAEAEARQAAERANQSKSEFLRTVTHELRSPLNAMIGFSDLIASGRFGPIGDDRYRSCAADVRMASQHMLSLVNDLLDLARVEAGQYDLFDSAVGLDEIVERAVRLAAPEAAARGMAIVTAAEDAPCVRADERVLLQCTLNLIINAVRYGNQNGRIAVTAGSSADGGAVLAVADSGPGIAACDLERVLRPFERVASDRSREVRGSGLGLPIVKRLVELHGGAFSLTSTLGIGTVARIELPRERVVPSEGEAPGDMRSAA